MATFNSFTEILAWQKARVLTKEIYLLTKKGEFKTDFGLRDQIRKSAVSIMANIAEGYGRRGDKQFAHFIEISIGSLFETESHLFVALDVEYISQKDFDKLFESCDEIFKMLNSLKRYLK